MRSARYSEEDVERFQASPQFSETDKKFRNKAEIHKQGVGQIWDTLKEYVLNKDKDAFPAEGIRTQMLAIDDFSEGGQGDILFSRLGHSTLLIRLGGRNWLTDPVFSKRASPVQWAGPKRFHEVPVDIDQLPDIDGVIISHNHYDHLDYGSIQQLKDRVPHFLVPLGIARTLQSWGVAKEKIIELDWWQKTRVGDVEFIATPAQHFSGRGLFDSDKTLWNSWVIRNPEHSIYFSGDTGYFPGFKKIGERYGPFDYAFMECGAYNKLWADIHMMPEETLQAFKDVKGKVLVPIHNGTFDLAMHAWFDPMKRITALAKKENIQTLLPVIGETVRHSQLSNTKETNWWKASASSTL
ncbi:hypothetical protein E1189_05285 [Sansalvadorimonas verongulae]|nr:hypothetical protein [Sansalvadorimonas verongulae]